ncbi:unnamed protein product [Adineta steineri]|uniref:Uncharacterized protein n=1 Tax=Adineta steineri TaxID=433720 RepID=A0A818VDW2_9BILA|nr:unnamed protein product [Adineta steineri]CAF3711179.1 unnamed protein product [Adineta steineri]
MLKTYHRLKEAAIKLVKQEDDNLVTYPLIWLDSLVNMSQENIDGQQLIRSSIDHLITFDNVDKCEEYIRSISSDERIILITSGRLGRELIPHIHQLRQVSSIYIYCLDKPANEQWAKQYTKIKHIVTKFTELIANIRTQRSQRSHNEVNELLLISIFQATTSNQQSAHFIYSQLLINVLLQMIPINTDKNKLIVLCKEKYHDIDNEMKLIQEFENNYSSNDAIYWYMRDSFIYRVLNKALQTQNIDLLFLFRFFIHDIRQALKQNKCTSSIQVYRSQLMTKEQINLLKNSIGSLISINSFFSTSIHRDLALLFLNELPLSDDTERVIFEITADPACALLKPFGFIKSNNSFRQTEEVLFTLGSIFRLINIQQQSDGMWTVQLTLCADNDDQLKEILKPFKTNDKHNHSNIVSFGDCLKKIGKLNDAEKFYLRLLNELPNNSQTIADCYYALGCIAMEKNMYDLSLKWHLRSLDIKLKILKEDDLAIADSHSAIGQIYLKKHDYKQALSSYLRALNITMQVKGEKHPSLAICYTNLGGVYQKQENYTHALECYRTALAIHQKTSSVDHPDLGISYNNIAIVYSCCAQYDLALENYNMALKILQNTLPPLHPEIAVSYCGLGLIFEQKGEFDKAYSYYEKTAVIYRQTLPSTHPDIIRIEQHIQRISSKL